LHTPGDDAEVTVPAGWQRGRKLRLRDRGIPAASSLPAGHLVLELEVVFPPADTAAEKGAWGALASAYPLFMAPQSVPD
jgi:curved DNA-binding protein